MVFVLKGCQHQWGPTDPWIFFTLPPPTHPSPTLHGQPSCRCRGSIKFTASPRQTRSRHNSDPASSSGQPPPSNSQHPSFRSPAGGELFSLTFLHLQLIRCIIVVHCNSGTTQCKWCGPPKLCIPVPNQGGTKYFYWACGNYTPRCTIQIPLPERHLVLATCATPPPPTTRVVVWSHHSYATSFTSNSNDPAFPSLCIPLPHVFTLLLNFV